MRWLPRRRVFDPTLRENDLWLFDGAIVRCNHFTGDETSAAPEVGENPADARNQRCSQIAEERARSSGKSVLESLGSLSRWPTGCPLDRQPAVRERTANLVGLVQHLEGDSDPSD
ncbi:DUF6879 family protein [Kitasatospora sp. NPDC093102]|uniref:DUF6879 family protein n=1 Tax=Kitasatospora sp. NPDC093102 TaxID=3155069 RepID=UPI00341EF809